MKRTLLFILLFLPMLSLTVKAQYVVLDDVLYYLDDETLTARVAGNESKKISGIVDIPETVSNNDNIYSVTSIGNRAFCYCTGLTSIDIPNSVTSIGEQAFRFCTNLEDFYSYAEQVPECYSSSFSNSNYKQATLHVPATSISAYNAVEPWKDFKEIVELTEEDMDYRPFIEDGKVWKVGYGSDNPIQFVEYYYFEGDTIIDGKTCKQMMCQRYVTPDYFDYEYFIQYPLLARCGVWYEEDKKVYVYDDTNKKFQIIYDFSLDAYGTLWLDEHATPFVVGPRQTGGIKGFKGVYRDVMMSYEGEYYHNVTWLEGVGSIDGPTWNVYYQKGNHSLPFLMACAVGDEVIYLNDEYEDGATPEGARKDRFDFSHTTKDKPKSPMRGEAEASETKSLYGEYNELQLGINLEPLDETYQVRITNETGNTVYEKAINAVNIVGLNIDISSYEEGHYTVTVDNSRETFTGQFEIHSTSIKEVRNNTSEPTNRIYNLQGQRISSLQKGLNIVNGQKVLSR